MRDRGRENSLPWRGLTLRSRSARELKRRALLRLTHGLLSSVFFAWAEHVHSVLEHRRSLLDRSMGRLQNRPLSDAFRAWLQAVKDARGARERLLAHAARHFVNHTAALAFDAWRTYMLWKRQLVRRTLGACSLLGVVFRTWVYFLKRRQAGTKGAFVLAGLEEVGTPWLMGTLGDLLPALLPEHKSGLGMTAMHHLALRKQMKLPPLSGRSRRLMSKTMPNAPNLLATRATSVARRAKDRLQANRPRQI